MKKVTLLFITLFFSFSTAFSQTLEDLQAQLAKIEKQVQAMATENQRLAAAVENAAENTVPEGTIVAFGGPESKIPSGYLHCNGAAYETSKYPKLAEALAKSWGGNNSGTKFNVPDLRGQFLRGWDETADVDPDKLARTSKNGSKSGNNVGSYQEDATALPEKQFTGQTNTTGEHKHNINGSALPEAVTINWTMDDSRTQGTKYDNYVTNPAGNHSHSVTVTNGGDAETRPNNACVIYIIKAE